MIETQNSKNARLWALIEAVSGPVLALATLAVLSHHAPTEEYGKLIFIQSWGMMLCVFGLGLPITLQIKLASAASVRQKKNITAAATSIVGLILILFVAAGVFLGYSREGGALVILVCVIGFWNILDQITSGVLRGQQKHKLTSKIDVFCKAAILVACVTIKPETYWWAISIYLTGMVAAVMLKTRFAIIEDVQHQDSEGGDGLLEMMKLLRMSPGPVLQQIAGQCFSSADKILIGSAASMEILAPYAIMQQVCAAIHLLPAQFQAPMIASIASQDNKRRRSTFRKRVIENMAFSLIIAVGVLLTWSWALPILFGSQNTEKITLGAMLAMIASYLLVSFQTPLIYYLQGVGRAQVVGWSWLAVALIVLGVFYGGPAGMSLQQMAEYRLYYGLAMVPLMFMVVKSLKLEQGVIK